MPLTKLIILCYANTFNTPMMSSISLCTLSHQYYRSRVVSNLEFVLLPQQKLLLLSIKTSEAYLPQRMFGVTSVFLYLFNFLASILFLILRQKLTSTCQSPWKRSPVW